MSSATTSPMSTRPASNRAARHLRTRFLRLCLEPLHRRTISVARTPSRLASARASRALTCSSRTAPCSPRARTPTSASPAMASSSSNAAVRRTIRATAHLSSTQRAIMSCRALASTYGDGRRRMACSTRAALLETSRLLRARAWRQRRRRKRRMRTTSMPVRQRFQVSRMG